MSNIYKREYLICPHCNGESDCRIDHLYKTNPNFESDGYGGWQCHLCHKPIGFRIKNSSEIETWKSTRVKQEWYPALALLKLNDVYFIFNYEIYKPNAEIKTNDKIQYNAEYFFEEHSCPTNWILKCIMIVKDGDIDPHGYMKFIRVIEIDNHFNEDDKDRILNLFPEIIIER